MKKRFFSVLLVFVILMTSCLPALAFGGGAGIVETRNYYEYFISGTNVTLRYRADPNSIADGQLGYGDRFEFWLYQGNYIHTGTDDQQWYSVHMLSGVHAGDNGFVRVQNTSFRTIIEPTVI